IAALALLIIKEAIHLYQSRSYIHSTFTGLLGIVFTTVLLTSIGVVNESLLIFGVLTATAYTAFSYFLRSREVEKSVFLPFEMLADILTVTAILLTFSLQIDSYKALFSLTAFTVLISSALYFALSAILAKREFMGKIYAYCAATMMPVSLSVLANHYGVGNWGDISGILIPFLILYILADSLLNETVFSGTAFIVAQVALPIVAALGIMSGLNRPVPPLSSAVFFIEISAFYLLSAYIKRNESLIYPGILTMSFALLKTFQYFHIEDGYFAGLL